MSATSVSRKNLGNQAIGPLLINWNLNGEINLDMLETEAVGTQRGLKLPTWWGWSIFLLWPFSWRRSKDKEVAKRIKWPARFELIPFFLGMGSFKWPIKRHIITFEVFKRIALGANWVKSVTSGETFFAQKDLLLDNYFYVLIIDEQNIICQSKHKNIYAISNWICKNMPDSSIIYQ